MAQGLIHIYHGNGKGKTTCAMGLCLRAVGAGKTVAIHQFLKNNKANERKALQQLPNVYFIDGQEQVKFTNQMSPQELEDLCTQCEEKLKEITQFVQTNHVDVLLLDEVLHLVNKNIIGETKLLDFLQHKPQGLEVILTGYFPTPAIVELADYVSQIQKEKHPFDQGVRARFGIEY